MDSLWVQNALVPALIAAAVLLLLLWPTRHSGRRLLINWGVPAPTEPQITEAKRYLRRRRILYVVLFVLLPSAATLIWPPVDRNEAPSNILVPLLAAMLIAELVATLRPARGVRVASLDRRTWRDLVPSWAIVVTAVLSSLAVGLAVAGLAAQPWADRYAATIPPDGKLSGDGWNAEVDTGIRTELGHPTGWLTLAGVVACLAVVIALVFLAVRRPSVSDPAVDTALRTRTARVAVAIGFMWLAGLVNDGQSRLTYLASTGDDGLPLPNPPGWLGDVLRQGVEITGVVVLVGAIVCWMWLAVPSRKSLARAAR